jgi:selenocysteine lyase/cysteine desulfurase
LNRLFRGDKPEHFVFTLNCSDALNLAIKGLVDPEPGGRAHAICTHIDHNSILRPLHALEERGWLSQTRVPVDSSTGLVDPDDIRRSIRPDTKLIAITHVSNVTGTVQPIREIGRIARERGIPFIVDAAQSAGHVPIDVCEDCIDLLAAPGHKALLGPLGTGFLYIRPGLEKTLRTIREGGTGSVSEQAVQPDFMPDKYEPGSHNAIGIIGLSEGVKWIHDQTVESLHARDRDLTCMFLEGIADIDGLTYYGPRGVRDRIGVFSVRIDGYEPQELSAVLESSFGILTRSGIHCAPLAHAAIGTAELGGTTRFSFGPFLSVQDVKYATDALAQISTPSSRYSGERGRGEGLAQGLR